MKKLISPNFFPTVLVHIHNFNLLSYLQAKKIDKYDQLCCFPEEDTGTETILTYWLLFNVTKYLIPSNMLVLACGRVILVTSVGNFPWYSHTRWSVSFFVSDMINLFHLIGCCLVDWFVSRNNAFLLQQLYSLASSSLKFCCRTVFIEGKERKGSFKKKPNKQQPSPKNTPSPQKKKNKQTPNQNRHNPKMLSFWFYRMGTFPW